MSFPTRARNSTAPIFEALTLCVLALLGLALGACRPADAEESRRIRSSELPADTPIKLMIQEDGVYRVSFEDLQEAGWVPPAAAPPATSGITLTCAGEPVPLRLDDGGDGTFDPGDAFEFVGEHLRGDGTWFHPHSKLNVYRLNWNARGDGRMTELLPPADLPRAPSSSSPQPWITERHREEDTLLLRFPARLNVADSWYWAKLTQIDPRPFRATLDLAEVDLDALERDPAALEIRVGLRGWSIPYGLMPKRKRAEGAPRPAHHRIEARLNDIPVGQAEWDDQEAATLVVTGAELPPGTLRSGKNILTLAVPKRSVGEPPQPLVDISLVDSIDLRYPRAPVVGTEQVAVSLPAGAALVLSPDPEGPQLYGLSAGSSRRATRAGAGVSAAGRTLVEHHFAALTPSEGSRVWAVPRGAWRKPARIEPDLPSNLQASDAQADYLMITHPKLREAIEPLAQLHRERGLKVAVVDVEDIYDEFNHGILDPQAIRDFLDHAYHHWPAPAPRFVLLVGDASWDGKNTRAKDANYADWGYRMDEGRRFIKNASTKYPENSKLNHRGLIPTWTFTTGQGQAATDNPFVTVEGDDIAPDMAIGRLPVTEPAEVAAIVEKIRTYVEEPPVGPWRRKILWITNEEQRFQARSDQVAQVATQRGFTADRVYPQPEEPSNAAHQQRLREAFDEGQLLIHFLGHGGRYIWRTGPPDLKKNHDLFTLEHLDELAPSRRLPVVLSMTCYSAPFDHPNADSIGEKLLRLDGRGAVAVLAASWRNSPSEEFSRILIEELTRPGTLGEAVMKAKGEIRAKRLIEMYNLLGDPAMPVAAPQLTVALEPVRDLDGWSLEGYLRAAGSEGATAPTEFAGRALIERLDAGGGVLDSEELAIEGSSFAHRLGAGPEAVTVRVYVWDEARHLDGVGQASLGEAVSALNVGVRP